VGYTEKGVQIDLKPSRLSQNPSVGREYPRTPSHETIRVVPTGLTAPLLYQVPLPHQPDITPSKPDGFSCSLRSDLAPSVLELLPLRGSRYLKTSGLLMLASLSHFTPAGARTV